MGPLRVKMDRPLRIQTASAQETQEMGRIIGRQAQPGDVYLLTGPLGSGKTCLTQGIGRGLCLQEEVRSPTFVLMTRRQGRLMLHHLDLYRIDNPWEVWDLGVDEQLFDQGVCVVEWADKAADLFPVESCWIALDYGHDEDSRIAVVSATSARFRELRECLAAAFPLAEEVF